MRVAYFAYLYGYNFTVNLFPNIKYIRCILDMCLRYLRFMYQTILLVTRYSDKDTVRLYPCNL